MAQCSGSGVGAGKLPKGWRHVPNKQLKVSGQPWMKGSPEGSP